MLLDIVLGVLGASAYIATGVRTARFLVASGYGEEYHKDDIGPCAFFGGVAWPVLLPTVAIYHAPSLLSKAVGQMKESKTRKIVPGGANPSKIADSLVATKILQDIDRVEIGASNLRWTSPCGTLTASVQWFGHGAFYSSSIETKGRSIPLKENSLTAKALVKARDLVNEKQKENALFQKEKDALDIVESLLLSPVKE